MWFLLATSLLAHLARVHENASHGVVPNAHKHVQKLHVKQTFDVLFGLRCDADNIVDVAVGDRL